MTKEQIINDAINVYCFGSYVYGVATERSDHDYIAIMPNEYSELCEQVHFENSDFNLFSEDAWIDMCKRNCIETLECAFLNKKYIIKETKQYNVPLNYDFVRTVISSITSNSFVKAKKKLIVEKDYNPYSGKKSLWHCLRLLLFGIQIMDNDRIVDYTIANQYYEDIVRTECVDWEYYRQKYKPIYNQLHSEFKIAHQRAKEK